TDELVVLTDERALRQIIINLTNNAIKFTEKGTIRLSADRLRDNDRTLTRISVVDTGIGIKLEDQAKLFQAFEQVHDAGRRRQEGTGLGLHLSQKLAGLLGGYITCESEYGHGSTFSLILKEARHAR
ncbi:MAG TPA: ATP-binding protein, partial [Blastocatellia bacterium]|nr:ATP-binding protein [Blastocatellia bacterium]